MKRVTRALRLYSTLIRVGTANALVYRLEFALWMMTLSMPLVMLSVTSAMARNTSLGWFDQLGFTAYYLTTMVVKQVSGAHVVWEITRDIRDGTLSLRLLRPIHPLATYAAESLAAVPVRGLLSLPLVGVLLWKCGADRITHDPVGLACLLLSVGGAWALKFTMDAMIGTLSLYLDSSVQVWQLWQGCFMLLSGYLIPLSLLPGWLRFASELTPFPSLLAVPVEIAIGLRTRQEALSALVVQWGWVIASAVGMFALWRHAVRRFGAYGG